MDTQNTARVSSAEIIGVVVPFAKTPYRWTFNVQTGGCSLLVRLRDEEAAEGWGEIPMLFHPTIPGQALELMATTLLDRLVIGKPPQPRQFVAEAMALTGWHFYPHLGSLIVSGIEMALWDLRGRQLGVHLTDLLGGRVRDRMECMWFVFDEAVEEMAAETKRGAELGFRCFYVKWSGEEANILEKVDAVGAELPPGAVLRIDPNESWTSASAIRYCQRLARWPIEFVEQPLPRFDLRGMAVLRRRCDVAIASDQATRTPEEAQEALALEAMDLLSVCPSDAGGIGRALEIAAMARASGLPVFLHSNVELGIAQAASVAIACVAENATYAGQTEYGHLSWDVTHGLNFDGPYLVLPEGPGLGIEVDREAVDRAHESYRAGAGNIPVLDSTLPRRFIPAY